MQTLPMGFAVWSASWQMVPHFTIASILSVIDFSYCNAYAAGQ